MVDDENVDDHTQAIHILACFKVVMRKDFGMRLLLDTQAFIVNDLVSRLDTAVLAQKKEVHSCAITTQTLNWSR